MKKIHSMLFVIMFIAGIFLIKTNITAQTTLSLTDKEQITNNLNSLVQAINMGDTQKISSLMSLNNPALLSKIQEQIRGGIAYQLDFSPLDNNMEMIGQDKIKVKARFSASGVGWNISGLSTYFVFEKQSDQWLITETDFYKKIDADYVYDLMKKVFIFVIPISLLLFIFWLLMLIDCIKREFDDRVLWIIMLIFLNFTAAILYFFIVKRKNITRKPLEFKM